MNRFSSSLNRAISGRRNHLRPAVYKTAALPTELPWRNSIIKVDPASAPRARDRRGMGIKVCAPPRTAPVWRLYIQSGIDHPRTNATRAILTVENSFDSPRMAERYFLPCKPLWDNSGRERHPRWQAPEYWAAPIHGGSSILSLGVSAF
jgi:hypothetical protein